MITLFKGLWNDTALAGSRVVPSEEAARTRQSRGGLQGRVASPQGSRPPHCPALCRRPGAVCPLRCSVLAGPSFPRAAPLMTDQVLKLHFRLWDRCCPRHGPRPAPPGSELRSRQASQLVGTWVLSSVPRIQPWGHRRFGQALWTALCRPFLEKHLSVNTGLARTFAVSLDSFHQQKGTPQELGE